MRLNGHDNDTLALCALAASRLFDAQRWAWAKKGKFTADGLDVPDAERILETLTYLAANALDGPNYRASTGRLLAETCPTVCDGCEGRCTQIWQHLGEVIQ